MKKINLILPVNGIKIPFNEGEHLYFLAGPIKGGGDWHSKAIYALSEEDPGCYICSPKSYTSDDPLFQHSLLSDNSFSFADQTSWERYYMELASHYGTIIFWLPGESVTNPREDGNYARDTRGEIGRWSIRSAFSLNPIKAGAPVNIVVGGESNFSGIRVIEKNLKLDHGGFFPVYSSLKETIKNAVRKAFSKKQAVPY